MSELSPGLAPFDQPVFLHDTEEAPTPDLTPVEAKARPVVAFVARSCVVIALAGLAPFVTDADIRLPMAVGVALHVTATTALELVRTTRRSSVSAVTLVALDVALLALVSWLTESATELLTVGLLAIAFHRWSYGRRAGTLSVALVTTTSAVLVGVDRVEAGWFEVTAVAAVGVLLVWLVDDQAVRHSRASAGLHLVASRAEAVLEGIGDAIVATDEYGRLREMNRAAGRLVGCAPSEVTGTTCAATLGLRNDDGPLECVSGCALLARSGSAVEVWRTGPQGNRQPLLASAVAVRDLDGDVLEVLHLLRDITSLKQADEAKTLFLATASHELKTPLSVIRGYAQLLTMDAMRERHDAQAEALRAIDARSRQLVDIVDRLLMSSRIESGSIELAPSMIDVGAIVADRSRAYAAAHPLIRIETALDAELDPAFADEAAVATVVDHLLENADKYSPDDATVEISGRADEDSVVIEIRDRGIGMNDEQIEQCFAPFWQAEGTDVRRFGGTGIGLYIVRSLVHAMHGTVSAESNAHGGMTFTVRFRRAPVTVDVASTHEPARPETTPDGEESMIREFMRQMGVLSEASEP